MVHGDSGPEFAYLGISRPDAAFITNHGYLPAKSIGRLASPRSPNTHLDFALFGLRAPSCVLIDLRTMAANNRGRARLMQSGIINIDPAVRRDGLQAVVGSFTKWDYPANEPTELSSPSYGRATFYRLKDGLFSSLGSPTDPIGSFCTSQPTMHRAPFRHKVVNVLHQWIGSMCRPHKANDASWRSPRTR